MASIENHRPHPTDEIKPEDPLREHTERFSYGHTISEDGVRLGVKPGNQVSAVEEDKAVRALRERYGNNALLTVEDVLKELGRRTINPRFK